VKVEEADMKRENIEGVIEMPFAYAMIESGELKMLKQLCSYNMQNK
jgi:hypothetical protein